MSATAAAIGPRAAGGLFTVALAPADTAGLLGEWCYRAEVTDASGNISTVRTGLILIKLGSDGAVADPAIVGEDGTGIVGAEAYGADPVALIAAYWTARPNDPLAAGWLGVNSATRRGTARGAATYLDATWGAFFLGYRASHVQGREWPRIGGLDEDGLPIPLTDALGRALPALPPQLLAAQAELAARAVSSPLAADALRLGAVKRERKRLATMEKEIEYADRAAAQALYGSVLGILAPLLNGAQPGAAAPTWFWR